MQLLPPASTPLERALELLAQIRTESIDTPLRALWRAETCPENILPWLAWALSIDNWDASWPVYIRRSRIGAAIAIQRIKGTAKSVEDMVRSFGGNVVVREWFEQDPVGAPHTFALTLTLSGEGGDVPTAAFIDAVIAEVARTKPARSHFSFVVGLNATGRIGLRGVARPAVSARIRGLAA